MQSKPRRLLLDQLEYRRRTRWPTARGTTPREQPHVAIVVANWNTRQLIAQLIFSLFRSLGRGEFSQIVVVDNGSTDGSAELLAALSEAGLVHAILNQKQRYHGPALNQGLSWLAERQAHLPASEQVDYVWVLDSDVVVLRQDTVRRAVAHLEQENAAAVGPRGWSDAHQRELLSIYSLLLDPTTAWRPPVPPFREDGEPSAALQLGLLRAGQKLVPFPFADEGYLLHVGRATLAQLVETHAVENRYLTWALSHNEPHFDGASEARRTYDEFLRLFDRELGELTPDRLIHACNGTETSVS
jgi:glycosyltransferase involved in cell wall biosynthesis